MRHVAIQKISVSVKNVWMTLTLPETKPASLTPENGWLEYDRFLLGPGLFSGAMLVSGRVVGISNTK